ncbi:hypothetical protein OG689_35355 [Kitasatospora sp. NBC_00240]|uniref:hypothetical protein n=1 Tax=Kitasatospora sp. NBC_00240 TaxID=2903567 RepID=UPI0022562ECD|nr:hypothetical protein [Kitasatospora sp. NBC_00240]MCX5214477.1 hypothetical protein [Kitasatospora sp. NBC_00240]
MTDTLTLTDAELSQFLPAAAARQVAAEQLMRRHGGTALAYARALCRHRHDAEDLVIEVFNRALDVVQTGEDHSHHWTDGLLGTLRCVAAERADEHGFDALSAGFLAWLDLRREPHRSYRSALLAAERDCLPLRALRGLPQSPAVEIWSALAPSAGDVGTVVVERPLPSERTRRHLADAYARAYAISAPERRCRHLVARMAHAVQNSTTASPEMTTHLNGCDACSQAENDLRLVHSWDIDALQERMFIRFPEVDGLDGGEPRTADVTGSPAAADHAPYPAGGAHGAHPPTFAAPPVPGRLAQPQPGRRRHAARRRPVLRSHRRAAAGAASAGALALAVGLALAPQPAPTGAAHAPVPSTTPELNPTGPSAPPAVPPQPPGASDAPTPATLTPSVTPTATAPRPVPPRPATPGPSAPATPPAPSPTAEPGITAPPLPQSPGASPSATFPGIRVLQRGDEGPDVAMMQHQLLARRGCGPTRAPFVRGRFDAATAALLQAFQQEAGIRGDERDHLLYGPLTREALQSRQLGRSC